MPLFRRGREREEPHQGQYGLTPPGCERCQGTVLASVVGYRLEPLNKPWRNPPPGQRREPVSPPSRRLARLPGALRWMTEETRGNLLARPREHRRHTGSQGPRIGPVLLRRTRRRHGPQGVHGPARPYFRLARG